jgi:hypothetical protein
MHCFSGSGTDRNRRNTYVHERGDGSHFRPSYRRSECGDHHSDFVVGTEWTDGVWKPVGDQWAGWILQNISLVQ